MVYWIKTDAAAAAAENKDTQNQEGRTVFQAVYGAAGAGKETYLYQAMARDCEAGRQAFLLVPEQASLSAEKAVIARLGIPAQKTVKVITFSRLCNLVFGACGPLRMRYIDSAGKLLVAQRAMQQAEQKLGYLRRNVRQKGFAQMLVETISGFKRYGISAAGLQQAGAQVSDTVLQQKLADLAVLFETYQHLLEEQHADAEDNLALACPKLPLCGFLRGTLYIHQFRSFTPNEYRAISILMRQMDVCIALCTDRLDGDAGPFAPVAEAYRTLCSLAEENGVPVSAPVALRRGRADDTPLRHLQDNYFAVHAKPYTGPVQQAVCLLAPQNGYQEVEAAARLIRRLCRTEGYRYSDFLLLARGAEQYRRTLPSVFAQNEIPVFLDSRRSIRTHPLVRLLLAGLEILAFGPSYERVMAALRTGMLEGTVSRADADLFENYLLATDPSHAMWAEPAWTYNPKERYDLAAINRIRDAVLGPISRMRGRLQGRKTAAEICGSLTGWMEELGLIAQVQARSAAFSAQNMPERAEEERQVWNAVLSVLAEIQGILGSELMSYQTFYELFEAACGGVEVGMVPQTLDSVVFSEIDRFRAAGARVVIVLGLNEGVFPKGYAEEGLITEREREQLAACGVKISPSLRARMQEEQLLVYTVLTAARERLYLSAPLADQDGKALQPSEIIRRIRTELFPSLSEAAQPDDLPESRQTAFQALAAQLAPVHGLSDRLPPVWQEIYACLQADADYAVPLRRLCDGIALAEQPQALSPAMVRRLYGNVLSLSATRLERYNACAFAYFAEYGLLARERDKASFDARGLGSVLHSVLYGYFEGLRQADCDYTAVTRAQCTQDIGRLVETEAKKGGAALLYESSYYYRYMILRMKGIAAATAWEIVRFYQSSAFRPFGYELRLGSAADAQLPPLPVQDADGKPIAAIDGFIDRADVAVHNGQPYYCVIDYKSSARDMDAALAEAGVQLQPLLYMDALCRHCGGEAGAMLYMNMNDPLVRFQTPPDDAALAEAIHKEIPMRGWVSEEILHALNGDAPEQRENVPVGKGTVLEHAEMADRLQKTEEKVRTAAAEILSGRIAAAPYTGHGFDACAYCPYGPVCQHQKKG